MIRYLKFFCFVSLPTAIKYFLSIKKLFLTFSLFFNISLNLDTFMNGSCKKIIFFSSKIFCNFISSNDPLLGNVIYLIFFEIFFQNNFLIKLSLGKPDILNMKFVSTLLVSIINRGSDVIRCNIK